MEIDFDEWLAPGADGSTPTDDFGDSLINDCFIPQIVFSTTFGYRTDVAEWNGKVPEDLCAVFDLENFPGKRSLEKRPEEEPRVGAALRRRRQGGPLRRALDTPEGVQRALAKLATIKDQVVWWSAGAETPQLLADKEVVMGSTYNGRLFSVIEEQKQPVAMLWDWQVFDFDGWVVPADLPEDQLDRGEGLHPLRHRHPAARRPGEVHLLRPGARLVAAAGRQARRPRHRHGAAHADQPGEPEELPGQQHRVVGRQPGRDGGALPGLADPVTLTRGRGRSGPARPDRRRAPWPTSPPPDRSAAARADARRRRHAAEGAA